MMSKDMGKVEQGFLPTPSGYSSLINPSLFSAYLIFAISCSPNAIFSEVKALSQSAHCLLARAYSIAFLKDS